MDLTKLSSFLKQIENEPQAIPEIGRVSKIYKAEKLPEIDPVRTQPSSPRSLANEARKYLLKQNMKGFQAINPKESLSEGNIQKQFSNGQNVIIADIFADDDEAIEFWLRRACVINAVSELRKLDYLDPSMLQRTIDDFLSNVRSEVVDLGIPKIKSPTKAEELRYQSIMKGFISSVTNIRNKIMTSLISKGVVAYDRLTPAQKVEFPKKRLLPSLHQSAPPEPCSFDELFLGAAEKSAHLPQAYMFTAIANEAKKPHPIDKPPIPPPNCDSRLQKANKGALVLASAIVRHKSPTKKPKQKVSRSQKEDFTQYYLEHGDPLKHQREGDFKSTLNEMASFCTDFDMPKDDAAAAEIPDCVFDPPKKEAEAVNIPKFSLPSVKTGPWMVPLDDPKVKPDIDCLEHLSFQKNLNKSPDMLFLQKQTPQMLEGPCSVTSQQLETIWNRLGFSAKQKLEMLAKYSETSEESGKLQEALAMWNYALIADENYQSAYHTFKEYLKNNEPQGRDKFTIDQLCGEFMVSEGVLLNSAEKLRSTYGDTLIVKRRKASDAVEMARARLVRLLGAPLPKTVGEADSG